MKGEILRGHLDMLLLAALARGPAHGYAVIDLVNADSGGVFDLQQGTVYPILHRLEHCLVLPTRNASIVPRRALGLDGAARTR